MNNEQIQALLIADDIMYRVKTISDKEAAANNARLSFRVNADEIPALSAQSNDLIVDSINEQLGLIIDAEVETVPLPIVRQVILLNKVKELVVIYNVLSRKIMPNSSVSTVKDRLEYLSNRYGNSRGFGEPYVIDVVSPHDRDNFIERLTTKIANKLDFNLQVLSNETMPDILHVFFTPKGENNISLVRYLKQVHALLITMVEEEIPVGNIRIDNIRDLELTANFIRKNATPERLKNTPMRGHAIEVTIGPDRDSLELALLVIDPDEVQKYRDGVAQANEAKQKELEDETTERKLSEERKKQIKDDETASIEESKTEAEKKNAAYSRKKEKLIRQKAKDLKPNPKTILSRKRASVEYTDSSRTTKSKKGRTKKKVTTKKSK